MTRFEYFSLHNAHKARGVVVVIDVLRAFTTAAHAFDAGAKRILPVAGVEEAFQLRKTMPGSLTMGEVDGVKPAGFDFGNSPDQFNGRDLSGCTMIQRTSAGTQGIVAAKRANRLFAASFVVAKATALSILKLASTEVSFVVTGESMDRDGDEDRACAEYIQALIQTKNPQAAVYTRRVCQSSAGASFLSDENRAVLGKDLDLCVQVDRFAFSMPIFRQGEILEMCCNYL
jgi:2-phosphosulfolactate phosphatase